MTARVRFQLRVRSKQLGSVNLGFQSSQVLSGAAKACCSAEQPRSKSKWQARLPFYLVSLRVQTDPLKNMHIKLDSHQALRVRYLISTRLIINLTAFSKSKCVFPSRDCLSFHVVTLFPEDWTDTNHSKNHQLQRLVLVLIPKEFKFQPTPWW